MAVKQSRGDMIAFLVDHRFPHVRAIRASRGTGVRYSIDGDDYHRVLSEADKFREALVALPDEKLAARVQEVQEEQLKAARAQAEAEENARFFNLPHAKADFKYWSKAAYWTIEEALALSLSRNPVLVNWETVKAFAHVSAFASEYSKLRVLLLRAVATKQLTDGTFPGAFLAWAKRNRFSYPQDLEDAVVEHGHQISDWKTLYDDLAERYAKLERSRDENVARVGEALKLVDEYRQLHDAQLKLGAQVVASNNEKTAKLTKAVSDAVAQRDATAVQRDALKAERSLLETERESLAALVKQVQGQLDAVTANPTEKPLHPSIRRSLDKMILGMAMDKFNFKPGALKSPATKNIADALLRHGLRLDADTVRTRLQEAVQEDPFDADKTEKSA